MMIQKSVRHLKEGRLIKVISGWIARPFRKMSARFPGLITRDLWNKLRYGWHAPLNHECIWVDPQEIRNVLVPSEVKRITGRTRTYTSGLVINWDEVEQTRPLMEEFKIRYCIEHWRDGKSWEELGVISFLKTNSRKHSRKSDAELEERFRMLDRAFDEVKLEGRLKTRKELDPANYREQDGILVHIGRGGELFFGSCGNHRLAMALVLGFNKIPAWVGLVDEKSIWKLKELRDRSEATHQAGV